MEKTSGFALAPNDLLRTGYRLGCRTGVAQVDSGTRRNRSDPAIITPARHRALILIKSLRRIPANIAKLAVLVRKD
jgi:hypothetical protein